VSCPAIPLILRLGALVALVSATAADVHLEEELTHSGVGSRRAGAHKTVRRIFVKGLRQRVETRIEASAAVARQLRDQGRQLQECTILQLDSARVYAVDPVQARYTLQNLPAAHKAGADAQAAAADAGADASREIHFRSRVLEDTLRLHGILCRRVAAELRARHLNPVNGVTVRQNRYLYQAWMAEEFPGLEEIRRFRERQRQTTAYPSLLEGGLAQMGNALEEGDRLAAEVEALAGFPMQSELRVTATATTGRTTPVFTLSRRVLSLSHTPLPDSLFSVSPDLRAEGE